MHPKESDSLLDEKPVFYDGSSVSDDGSKTTVSKTGFRNLALVATGLIGLFAIGRHLAFHSDSVLGTKLRATIHSMAEDVAERTDPIPPKLNGSGNYSLIEAHTGKSFFDYYTFFDGWDSLGSAGYNTYVVREKAESLGIAKVVTADDGTEYVELSSKAGEAYDDLGNRPRDSVRLEGNLRFNDGLFILDVMEMPTGCGLWPAFWSTDGEVWPDHGEIDIVEPVNTQTIAKTVLHTTEKCDMYAHVPRWEWTGHWDVSTGVPEFSTGIPDYDTKLETDNCFIGSSHQWLNQGCAAVHPEDGTLGEPMNERGGGVYAMEWDPAAGFIRTWVFPRSDGFPDNLREALDEGVRPDPAEWPKPYAFFPIGPGTGCSRDHFQNHNLVINLAICGTVGGNRFANDCPDLFEKYNVNNDSVATCNAYVDSDEARTMLDETAKWKIKGVYVYQRDEE
mmetsp:Transcript_25772/g.60423  ORF Transcript_25772/g.60423 Transcript_25772/m.60423 type:complete len:449 (-) Transcript_25772:158-1504(-)|eukprot:CAMPEP_0197179764 /NCGR_PEP_ID=MMETSP1423-20130617/4602_1 /TAXON_ID=476441 /ORGANISM="Pseudo-nitzschia heimii, Strain UNC1101" /LENGTH=448 /DNA_ID=CAMNT_0042629719 /DNA_START=192 /DNA_END=1538 /DNA_ORIENTATION=+